MKPRFVVLPEKGIENGKWTGKLVYEVHDTQGLQSSTLVISYDSEEAAQRHCDRLNNEEAGN
ncbi:MULTISPECIES: hypothetical protein [unclassified Pseudomonas]|uniref:hypothetical protein n=1 Tax=unclassified Pseudomonas TaxID=196821 RepID=UPI002580AFC2|nr:MULTISPECIES: hypothetical protein [unclassified Pseudomonas]